MSTGHKNESRQCSVVEITKYFLFYNITFSAIFKSFIWGN